MRVLILNTVCCWRKSNSPFVDLGRRMAERGVDVHHIVGGGEVCTYFGTLADWTQEKCESTQARVTADIEGVRNPVRNLRSFATPEMRSRVDEWWNTACELPPHEREYKGFRMRNLVRGSLARHIYRPLHPDPLVPGGEEDGTPEERDMSHRMVRAAALGIEIAEAALAEIQPDVVLLFNGYFYLEWIFSAVAKRMGVRAVAHEAACFADRMYFDASGQIGNRHFMSSNAVRHRMDAHDFSQAERSRLEDYLRDIYEGRVNTIAQADGEDMEALRNRLELPRDKPIVLLIGQVAYDTVVIYDSGTYLTLLDYLRAGIEAARQVRDCHLVIRLHPHEMAVNDNWTWRQIQTWALPDNVTVVHSRNANTYQLMEIADCGLAMTSQAGLEMAAFGKPVVVCGNAFYKGKGFTYDVAAPHQLQAVLEEALNAGGTLPADRQEKLDVYLHHHIFNYLFPFDPESFTFSDETVDRILGELAPVASKPFRESGAPPVENLVANPDCTEDTAGWNGAGAEVARLAEAAQGRGLRCKTGEGAWSGVLYGCAAANQCDEKTIPCAPGAHHSVSVDVKGLKDFEGVEVQVHAIGNGGQSFSAERATLSAEWTKVTLSFTTKEDTSSLGVQIVKRDNPRPVVFAVRGLEVTTVARQPGAAAAPAMDGKPGSFPRLLVVTEVPFGNHTGYGVTITNLFRGWPKDRLAQIYRMTDYEPDYSVCEQYLRLYDSSRATDIRDLSAPRRYVTKRTMLATGMLDTDSGGHRASIKRAMAWARPFKPDVIFSSPVTYATAEFSRKLSRALGVPYVCHIMDDWLAQWEAGRRPECNGRLEPLMRPKRNTITRRLFEGAASRQVISREMAEAYQERYNYEFEVVHNAVDLRQWDLGPRDYSAAGRPFRILYTGAIWWNIQMPTLKDFAETIAELAEEGHSLRLEIYTHPSFEKMYAKELARPPHVQFCGLAPYDEMPRLMREADALLVPVTFDEDLLLFSKHSMPTKLPEYMMSGTPVILHGPAEATPVAYAIEEKWGCVIDKPSRSALKERLLALMNDAELREKAGAPARELAIKRHDLRGVRQAFWDSIQSAASRAGGKP